LGLIIYSSHALGFSAFIIRILATDLQQSHCNFKAHMKSSFRSLIPVLPLFCNCHFRRLSSAPLLPSSYDGRLASRNSILHSLCCSTGSFFITTLHVPHRKHRLPLSRIVLGVFTGPLHSNGCSTDHIENSLSTVQACIAGRCLPSRYLRMGIYVTVRCREKSFSLTCTKTCDSRFWQTRTDDPLQKQQPIQLIPAALAFTNYFAFCYMTEDKPQL
jgi:hypothetical protein